MSTSDGGHSSLPSRTIRTGQCERWASPVETLPSTMRPSRPIPRLPTTTSPTPISSARAMIASTTCPSQRCASETVPPSSSIHRTCSSSVSRPASSSPILMTWSKWGEGTVCQMCTTCSSAPPFFARSTAALAARVVFSNPSVASNIFSGKPFIFQPLSGISSSPASRSRNENARTSIRSHRRMSTSPYLLSPSKFCPGEHLYPDVNHGESAAGHEHDQAPATNPNASAAIPNDPENGSKSKPLDEQERSRPPQHLRTRQSSRGDNFLTSFDDFRFAASFLGTATRSKFSISEHPRQPETRPNGHWVTCCHPGESLRSPQAHQCPRSFQQDEPRLPVHATTTARMPESRKFATYLVADLRRVHETELADGVGTQYGEHPKTGVSRSRRGPPA